MATLPESHAQPHPQLVADAALAPSEALRAPRTARHAQVGRRQSATMPDQLAEARRRKTAERTAVARYVDERLDAMEHQEVYTVPMLYVAVAGSLAPAHLLSLVAQWSEQSYAATGSGWVRQPVQAWVNYSGLLEADWMMARELLRERGLIEERRRYDMTAGEIVTEIAFVPSVFATEVAKVREELREDAKTRLRDGLPL
ncbi:MAG: hypothetical protein CFE44_13055 [Burkholderiales bacterium PBB4]|nr:MAG: hypothetical protein CFE44_13055 [Burkholderiales bacterium PBB4]